MVHGAGPAAGRTPRRAGDPPRPGPARRRPATVQRTGTRPHRARTGPAHGGARRHPPQVPRATPLSGLPSQHTAVRETELGDRCGRLRPRGCQRHARRFGREDCDKLITDCSLQSVIVTRRRSIAKRPAAQRLCMLTVAYFLLAAGPHSAGWLQEAIPECRPAWPDVPRGCTASGSRWPDAALCLCSWLPVAPR